MLIQILAALLYLSGFFFDSYTLFLVGGISLFLLDLVGFWSGKLKPLFPIILYFIGYLLTGNFWYGLFLGAFFGVVIEIVFTVLVLLGLGSYKLFKKFK